jgi:predicted membrane protein
MASSNRTQNRIFWGVVLIGLGVLFLLDQLGQLDARDLISRYWPVIFIIIGVSILIGNNFKNAGGGVFFILFGAFFLLVRLRIFHYSLWHYWPVLIIALGLWILIHPAGHGDKKKIPEMTADDLAISQVFSGMTRRVESQSFRGGTAEVVFGSADIDLTGAKLEGGRADLVLSVVFGRIDLRVPPDWQVVVEGTPVLGSIEQDLKASRDAVKSATLTVKSSIVLGAIHIRD